MQLFGRFHHIFYLDNHIAYDEREFCCFLVWLLCMYFFFLPYYIGSSLYGIQNIYGTQTTMLNRSSERGHSVLLFMLEEQTVCQLQSLFLSVSFITGVPNPGYCLWPVRNGAAQQEVSGKPAKVHQCFQPLPITHVTA